VLKLHSILKRKQKRPLEWRKGEGGGRKKIKRRFSAL